ncbi:hypothetical protein ONA91_41670, partial [Micromonospora sp. DR5-3]|uniref:hypothetical protein n=1 Tax=unclassified Micromonospora TaxID=2617518 RepID=UPI001CA36436
MLTDELMPGVDADEALVVVGFGVQPLTVPAQPVLLGQDPGRPELTTRPQRRDPPALVQSQ